MPSLNALRLDPRVTVRRDQPPHPDGRVVVYWMQRAQRAVDNPALDVAIAAANELHQPVVVFMAPVPFYPRGNLRHYQFLFEGLSELPDAFAKRRVGFVFRLHPHHRIVEFCSEVGASMLVGDENPLREPAAWRAAVAREIRIPFWTVDADVIVPSRLLEKEQYAARTIRPRIRRLLGEHLGPVEQSKARVVWRAPHGLRRLAPPERVPAGFPVDRRVGPVAGHRGGTAAGLARLRRFVVKGLTGYATRRNRPEIEGTSGLSPYLHFGHLGPRLVALAARDADAPKRDRDAFLEELIVRRELAVNFVVFNDRYDSLAGAEPWARRTLGGHLEDDRDPRYTPAQLERAETHDPLWNAAQRQMVESGWMHGYMRMYWAKKILEWSRTPEDAFAAAVELNDRYELDGRDPNGYAGIAWAIGGKHDRAWGPEREIFGKVRYMSYESTRRKFDSEAYIRQWPAAARRARTHPPGARTRR